MMAGEQAVHAARHPDGQAPRQADSSAWEQLGSAEDPQVLCRAWLDLTARAFAPVQTGLVLLKHPWEGNYVPAAFWPDASCDVTHLTAAAQQALMERRGVEIPPSAPPGQGAQSQTQLAIPIETEAELHGVAVLGLVAGGPADVQAVRRWLLWGSAWLAQFFYREQARQSQASLERVGLALDLALLALEKKEHQEAAMALVNEMAVKLGMRRVSLGLAKQGEIRAQAVSHTAHFQRQSEAVQLLEQAMEEAFDQRRDVLYPQAEGGRPERFAVTSDHERLAKRQDAGGVASFLLADQGEAFGVLTFESEAPLGEPDRLLCEALAKVAGPVLAQKRELDHWLTGKSKFKLQALAEKLLGPSHPAFKLKAIALAAALGFLGFADGEFRVSAKTVVEGLVQRQAVAPFQGYIQQASVRAGDTVTAGQVLATLDDKDLRLEQIRWQSEREQTLRKYHDALAKHDRAEASVLGAQLDQAIAQLNLIEEKLKRSQIRAPFDGIVVSGDLSQLLGAPVEQGKVLFEVTPLDAYRVILKVDERDITYVRAGQPGQLVLSGLAGEKLGFAVKKITSVSTAEEGINYFRVEAQLDAPAAMIRPGMEGVGKIIAGERKLAWIWTRRLTDWLTVKLWSWLP